ncbi:3'-5' exoribonuclease [Clostridium gasigenes]|uniref:exonuclease domain-containing protein n=1 Tax=Clostridium gasigenes TaxID=94869 RepID=UPI001625481F|nr:exonuclease domain-containing protein [Clostridium gasigenes]MBB6623888.1 3'-5' exoribonuclease [Clostridium gasigenes]
MNFVAIDFETANEKRNSACSIGITVVEDNKIIEERYWLIKPCEMRFEPINIWIHGIKEEDVENEKTFLELWSEIKPYLDGKLVVAHNASFDMSVLRKTLDSYNIPYPTLDYFCSMIISRNFYSYLENSKLNTINNHLGYKFNHHNASADASASANIVLEIIKELKVEDIEELSKLVCFKIGKIHNNDYTSAGKLQGTSIISTRVNKNVCNNKTLINTTDFFRDKIVVFTGGLSSMSRLDAMQFVKQNGGSTGSSVTKKTNILITAVKNVHDISYTNMSTKLKRAKQLNEFGQGIDLLNEEEFLSYVK